MRLFGGRPIAPPRLMLLIRHLRWFAGGPRFFARRPGRRLALTTPERFAAIATARRPPRRRSIPPCSVCRREWRVSSSATVPALVRWAAEIPGEPAVIPRYRGSRFDDVGEDPPGPLAVDIVAVFVVAPTGHRMWAAGRGEDRKGPRVAAGARRRENGRQRL